MWVDRLQASLRLAFIASGLSSLRLAIGEDEELHFQNKLVLLFWGFEKALLSVFRHKNFQLRNSQSVDFETSVEMSPEGKDNLKQHLPLDCQVQLLCWLFLFTHFAALYNHKNEPPAPIFCRTDYIFEGVLRHFCSLIIHTKEVAWFRIFRRLTR